MPTYDSPVPPAAGCSAWLDPPGPPALPQFCERGASVSFDGVVAGTWGGESRARARVTSAAGGFDATLALDAGDAVNSLLRGGGHRRDWVLADDATLATGVPLTLVLQLSIEGELAAACRERWGWGADPGGAAFVGSEDHDRRPLRLRLALDPQRAGRQAAQAAWRVIVPNRQWTALPMRFAVRLRGSLDQPLDWQLRARVSMQPLGAPRVRCRVVGAGAPAPMVGAEPPAVRTA